MAVYMVLVISMYCIVETQSANGDEKCLLPSDRRPQYYRIVGVSEAQRAKIKRAELTLKYLRGTLKRRINQAFKTYKRYCGKPNFSSRFPGFTVDNFQTNATCPGYWVDAPLPEAYVNDKNWICYTLPKFFALKCPYYVCNGTYCNLGSNAPDPNASPRVVYQCQLASFVDVPYYAFCINMGILEQFEFSRQKLILPRCCECTKNTCTE